MKNMEKLYLIALASTAMILFLILVSSTASVAAQSASPTITETRITTNGAVSSFAIYGDKIVWDDYRNGEAVGNIYMHDLLDSQETQITTYGTAYTPDIYGDRIVWCFDLSTNSDIYMYNISTHEETQIITTEPVLWNSIAIYGDKIVWSAGLNGNQNIHMYDLLTFQKTQITTSGVANGYPKIYSDRIVWEDHRNGKSDIYMYNISTSQETQITNSGSASSPDVYGDRIVWSDYRGEVLGNIYMYDLPTHTETQITNSGGAINPAIYGDRIVWMDDSNVYDIYMYDLSTQQKTQITNSGSAYRPAVHGDRIVWSDNRNGNYDIYMATVSGEEPKPEPFSAGPYAYITNSDSDTVSVIDTTTNNVIATVPVGNGPGGVAVSPDGTRIYVTNAGSHPSYEGTVSVINTATNNVTVTVNVGEYPWGVVVTPDEINVYVANALDNTVSVIDVATNNVTATVPVGLRPQGVAITPDGSKIYVTHSEPFSIGRVSVINTSTNNVTTVNVGYSPYGVCCPYGVAVSPDGKKVYVTDSGTGVVYVIDTATNNVTTTVTVGNYPNGVAITPDGTKAYVTNYGDNTTSVIDTATNKVIDTVSVGKWPRGIAVTPGGSKVYVTNYGDNTTSVIDTATNNVTATVTVGSHPNEIAVGPALETVPIIKVGQGASTPEITQKFNDACNRSGGLSVLGNPTTEVHDAFGYEVQDFPEMPATDGGVIMYNPNNNTAYFIHGAIWDKYYDYADKNKLGAVASDEKVADISPQGTVGKYTEFENGCIHWISNKEGENEDHSQRGESFVTYGDLNKMYDEMGGTGSELGFPIADQITNADGHDYCEFEGGNISWDASTSAYVVKLNDVVSTIKVGQGASTPEITQKFNDACNRSGGLSVLGNPTTEVHDAFGYEVQDFPEMPATDGGVIMYNPNNNTAYFIHGAIWDKYYDYPDKAKLGPVASDEGAAAILPRLANGYLPLTTSGNFTKFETGTIHWISNRDGENPDHPQWGKSFVTYGDLDAFYTKMGGTYSELGFPIKDQETKADGHGYCEFDGGNISWDISAEKYIVNLNHIESYPEFSFVQITDIHVGDLRFSAQDNLKNIVSELNNMSPKPKFVLVTGDLVWYDNGVKFGDSLYNSYFDTFNNIMRTNTIDTKYVPGNHDRRTDGFGILPQSLTGYKRTISDQTDEIEFDESGFKFIGLDSGEDYNVSVIEKTYEGIVIWASWDDTPESNGLSEGQINYLEDIKPNRQPKIIFMHHPAIASKNDVRATSTHTDIYGNINLVVSSEKPVSPIIGYGGNDGCIAFWRNNFIDYCKDNNVQLVITGHSHNDIILSANGEIRSEGSTGYPLFIQTDAAADDFGHYRVFNVANGIVTSEAVAAKDNSHMDVSANCPVNLRVYDSQNRYTGLDSSGEIEIGIPNSFYEGRYNDTEPINISLYDVNNEYRFEVVANFTEEQKNSPEIETFNLTVEQYINKTTNTTVIYRSVPLTENTIAIIALNLTTTNHTMEIDSNGDGVKDDTREPNSININGVETIVDRVPPQSITNLQSTNSTIWINWTWSNPNDPDFNHTGIYLNNIFQTNTSAEFFNATNLEPETDYTIGTCTVDIYGGVSETWVNLTATTTKAPIIVEAGSDQTVEEGSNVDFKGSFTASGSHTYSYHWDFGDESTEDGSLTTSHTYADNGVYTVNLTVTDEEGDFGNDTLLVTVNNIAPDVEAGSDLEVTAGYPVYFSCTFSDTGWLDTHIAEWNLGEGTLETGSVSEENEYPDSTGTVSGSFSYFDAGDYTVTLNVSDDDGGIGQDQLTVTVLPIVAEVNLDPDTLNIGSGGEWVTAYIELPEGYDVAGINASTVLLNGEVSAVTDPKYGFVTDENEYLMDRDGDGITERMLKFDREEVESILEAGEEVTVTLTGKVEYDNGISSGMASFEGSDVIKVIEKKKDKTK